MSGKEKSVQSENSTVESAEMNSEEIFVSEYSEDEVVVNAAQDSEMGSQTETVTLDDETHKEDIGDDSVIEPEDTTDYKVAYKQVLEEKEALTVRLRSVSAAYQQKSTEVQATKERIERQMQLKEALSRGKVVSSIFEPFENLKRSIQALRTTGVSEDQLQGLEMVQSSFWDALQSLGLEEIPGVGSLFNPNIHTALTTMPVNDPAMNDAVVQVYATGYRINDIVVRQAQVIVGQYIAPPSSKPETAKVDEPIALDSEQESTSSTSSESESK